ncbi:hypothetical protein [Paenibacillus sp. SN-8-1]|uniref:hypothetical protein n=1 Tax=Paenibacillus sp. SN-8-1 TaxID=3435409 RepID=UPI003D9A43A8
MDKYTKLKFILGSTIEDAVKQLLEYRKQGKLACCDFNGTTLFSDTVTMDDAYMQITGKTKYEFDNQISERTREFERQEREHKEKIPELTELWRSKGKEVLPEDRWELWDKIVPIRLDDLYQGMELGSCLEIVSILNNNGSLDEAKVKIESQGHSGMSYGLVCSMVKEFSDRGEEFVNYVR